MHTNFGSLTFHADLKILLHLYAAHISFSVITCKCLHICVYEIINILNKDILFLESKRVYEVENDHYHSTNSEYTKSLSDKKKIRTKDLETL